MGKMIFGDGEGPVIEPIKLVGHFSSEVFNKPSFDILEVVEEIKKPVFSIQEVNERVIKPSFTVVAEESTVVTRPSFKIVEDFRKVEQPVFKVVERTYEVQTPHLSAKQSWLVSAALLVSLALNIILVLKG